VCLGEKIDMDQDYDDTEEVDPYNDAWANVH
jgi:hypothetical protein